MEIRQLKHFKEIAKFGTLSQASESSFITVQGISMSLNRLESELGIKLFDRSAKGMALTKAGEFFLPKANEILDIIDECDRHFHELAKSDKELTVMLAPEVFFDGFIHNTVYDFSAVNDDISLEIREGGNLECEQAVINETVDLALCSGPINESVFDAHHVASDRYVLVVNKKDKLAKKDFIRIADLNDQPLVLNGRSDDSTKFLTDMFIKENCKPNIKYHVADVMPAFFLAENKGCSFITTSTIANNIPKSNVNIIPFEEDEMTWDAFIIQKKNKNLSPSAEKLKNALLA